MNKYTELLEKHVQWIALGIGGLWLLFMIYSHVIVAESASVEVGGEQFNAHNVDKYVLDTKGIPLREAMQYQGKLTEVVKDYPKEIRDRLSIPLETVARLDGQWIKTPGGMGIGDIPGGVQPPAVALVQSLPVPPQTVFNNGYGGRSVINRQPPGAPAPIPTLVSWVTVHGVIPMADLAKAFAAVNLPALPQLHQTAVLKVELEREELLPDGSWGKKTTIPSQDFAQGAVAANAWPAKGDQQLELQYAQWAAANQRQLTQPGFYAVVRGDPWHAPGQAPAPINGQPMAPPPIDFGAPAGQPAQPGRAPQPAPPQKRPLFQPRGAITPPPGVTPVAQTFEDLPPSRVGAPPVMAAPGAPGAPGANVQPPANQPGAAPSSQFDPANANDINVWVHDTTVEPGKTYRYAIKYAIKNPIFSAINVAKPGLNNIFALESQPSQPTPSITVPHTVIFFATSVNRMAGGEVRSVTFEVFTWDVNGLSKKIVTAVPGDMIDETLKLTVVDVRGGGSEIILMHDNGILAVRNINVDAKNNKQLEQLRMEADQAVAPPLAQQ